MLAHFDGKRGEENARTQARRRGALPQQLRQHEVGDVYKARGSKPTENTFWVVLEGTKEGPQAQVLLLVVHKSGGACLGAQLAPPACAAVLPGRGWSCVSGDASVAHERVSPEEPTPPRGGASAKYPGAFPDTRCEEPADRLQRAQGERPLESERHLQTPPVATRVPLSAKPPDSSEPAAFRPGEGRRLSERQAGEPYRRGEPGTRSEAIPLDSQIPGAAAAACPSAMERTPRHARPRVLPETGTQQPHGPGGGHASPPRRSALRQVPTRPWQPAGVAQGPPAGFGVEEGASTPHSLVGSLPAAGGSIGPTARPTARPTPA